MTGEVAALYPVGEVHQAGHQPIGGGHFDVDQAASPGPAEGAEDRRGRIRQVLQDGTEGDEVKLLRSEFRVLDTAEREPVGRDPGLRDRVLVEGRGRLEAV